MLTVLSVLRSGGIYDAEWVRKLRDGVARNLRQPHRFACLSDVEVPCERIALLHDWKGWWAKIELFRPGVVTGPTLYFDLDNVPLGPLDFLAECPHEFAMLPNFNRPDYASSCVMWWKTPQHHVYEKFAEKPGYWREYHRLRRSGPYLGDQAFIWECWKRQVPMLEVSRRQICSYRVDVLKRGLPAEAAMVCFGGEFKPSNVRTDWLERAWM